MDIQKSRATKDPALQTAGRLSIASVDAGTVTPDRPRCVVVGTYCEALGWLRREPACPASACCRHFWADAEAEAS